MNRIEPLSLGQSRGTISLVLSKSFLLRTALASSDDGRVAISVPGRRLQSAYSCSAVKDRRLSFLVAAVMVVLRAFAEVAAVVVVAALVAFGVDADSSRVPQPLAAMRIKRSWIRVESLMRHNL